MIGKIIIVVSCPQKRIEESLLAPPSVCMRMNAHVVVHVLTLMRMPMCSGTRRATSSPGPSPRSKWRSEKPLRLLKYSTNRGVFCHVTHDEVAFSEVVSSVWRPCLFSAIGNRYSNKTKTFLRLCVTKF